MRLEAAAPELRAETRGAVAAPAARPDAALGGGWLAGIAMVLRSPYLAGIALWVSLLASGLMLFAMGALKSRWTGRHWLPSGLEIFCLGAFVGVAGYFFGKVLPAALGVAGVVN